MKYLIISTENMIFNVQSAKDDKGLIEVINGKPIDKVKVYEIAREVKLKEQPSIAIQEEE